MLAMLAMLANCFINFIHFVALYDISETQCHERGVNRHVINGTGVWHIGVFPRKYRGGACRGFSQLSSAHRNPLA